MTPEIGLLMVSAATIAFVHTLMGPDHYLPFVSMAAARRWSMARTLSLTALCGIGHLIGSVALGSVGIALQAQVQRLEWVESIRGDLAAWALLSFGLIYAVWGLQRAWKRRPGGHFHRHGHLFHSHPHADHSHDHSEEELARDGNSPATWFIFLIFVLGPCEPLIPLLMVPAAQQSGLGLLLVTAVFGLVTLLTMLFAVAVSLHLVQRVRWPGLERFGHAIAGTTMSLCAVGILFLGL